MLLLLPSAARADETYRVVFHRPATVGNVYRVQGSGQTRWSQEDWVGEADRRPLTREESLALEAEGEVLAVGPAGEPTEVRFTIARFDRLEGGRSAAVLGKGSTVVAVLAVGEPRYSVEGTPAGDDVSAALHLVLDGIFATAREETFFGPGTPKRPGDGWPVHAQAVATYLHSQGLTVRPEGLRGSVRFQETADVESVRCLVLAAEYTAAVSGIPVAPGLEVTTSEVFSRVEITVPVDPASLFSRHRRSRGLTVEASGRGRGGQPAFFRRTEAYVADLSVRPRVAQQSPGPRPAPNPVVGVWVAPMEGRQGRILFRQDGTYVREWPEGAALMRFRGTYEVNGPVLLVEDSEEPGTLQRVPFRKRGNDGLDLTIEGEVLRFSRATPTPLVLPPYKGDERERAALAEAEAYLAGGGPVDARDQDGWTRLHLAARRGQADLVARLLQARADPNAATPDGATPLHMAAAAGQPHVIARLLDAGADAGGRSPDGDTPLSRAIAAKQATAAALLIQRGAPLESRNRLGWTPLLQAVHSAQADVARVLLEHGASIDARADDGQTALHVALRERQVDAVRLLLDQGADPRAPDQDGETPLHVAAGQNLVPFLARLLEAGADLEARTKRRFTPLHEAAWAGKLEATEFLLSKGADPTAASALGTPEDVARRQGNLDVAHRLMDAVRTGR